MSVAWSEPERQRGTALHPSLALGLGPAWAGQRRKPAGSPAGSRVVDAVRQLAPCHGFGFVPPAGGAGGEAAGVFAGGVLIVICAFGFIWAMTASRSRMA